MPHEGGLSVETLHLLIICGAICIPAVTAILLFGFIFSRIIGRLIDRIDRLSEFNTAFEDPDAYQASKPPREPDTIMVAEEPMKSL
jgi:hypothetical protein